MTAYATSLGDAYRIFKSDSEWRHERAPLNVHPDGRKFTKALAADLAALGIDPSSIKFDQAVTASRGYEFGHISGTLSSSKAEFRPPLSSGSC